MLEVITVALTSSVVLIPVLDAVQGRLNRNKRSQMRLGQAVSGGEFCVYSGAQFPCATQTRTPSA